LSFACFFLFFDKVLFLIFVSRVKYLDSLELKDMHINEQGTRVSVWTDAMVKKYIQQDTGSDGCFGMAAVI